MFRKPLLLFVIAGFVPGFVADGIPEEQRIDCLVGFDEDTCRTKGCIWEPTDSPAPDCYLPPLYGYRTLGDLYDIENGKAIDLVRSSGQSLFGDDFQNLTVSFQQQTDTRLRVLISPPGVDRFEVPGKIAEGPGPGLTEYLFSVKDEPVFSFQIQRRSSGTILFDSSLGGLTFSDQFLQISGRLPSANVYGLGEHEQPSFKHDMNWKTWGMFAHDHAVEGGFNLYGVHPHYTVLEEDGNAHGVLFLNSNAQEVTLLPTPGLVYRTIGGVLDIYFFLGPTPEDVVSQYTEAVGRYYVPPYWSLGFHLCRWGYNSLDNMRAAWQRTRDAGIPFDVQWGDIDYMDRVLDFTTNPTEFAELPEFVDMLHEKGMKFVPILDPCITTGEAPGTYPPYDEGSILDVWVKNSSGQPLVGKVWPADNCHFPDFSNPNTKDWWVRQLETFHEKVPFDGIWIDMNEPANFVTGSVEGCPDNKWNNPPYKPKTDGDTMLEKTICLDAEQSFGRHYDTHSLYGWSQSEPTLRGVQSATGKRGLVVSRSTFVGSGKWAAHWLGDNWSEWDNMHFSIIGMMQFNQFGYPLVGADICGFIGNTTEELCARWHQLGAFYPFTRNHNVLDAYDQDPGVWEGGLVARVARRAIEMKYRLLPYIYSLFYQHTLQGGTVARPLWHEFPRDATTWDIDTQFMLGPAVLVAPILKQGQNTREVYLPTASIWYTEQQLVSASGVINVESDLSNENHTTPVFIRGGYVLPMQQERATTEEQRNSGEYWMLVAPDREGSAVGELFLDDGESINSQNLHTKIVFEVSEGVLFSTAVTNNYKAASENVFTKITILGIVQKITQVTVNNQLTSDFIYDAELNNLVVNLSCSITEPLVLHWFY